MASRMKTAAMGAAIFLAFATGVGVRYYSVRGIARPPIPQRIAPVSVPSTPQLTHVNQLVMALRDRTRFPVVEGVQFFSKTYEMHVTIEETTWADWEQQQSFYRIAIPTEIGKAYLRALQDDGIRHPTAGVVFLSTSGRTVALYAPALGGFQFLEGR